MKPLMISIFSPPLNFPVERLESAPGGDGGRTSILYIKSNEHFQYFLMIISRLCK